MRVAVVIPCHNVEAHLPSALGSVMAQTNSDLDVVCIDDGSTDGTAGVLLDLQERFPGRFRSILQKNLGASAARNAGLRSTTGDYVQFLDADDTIDPDKIAAQIALAKVSGYPDLVVGDFEQAMPNGLLLPSLALVGQPWMALIKTRMGTTSSNLWSRSALDVVGGWNEDLASSQDYDLMFRLLKNSGSIAWDAHIRTHVLKRASGSISQTGVQANWDRYIALRRAIMEYLRMLDPERYAPEIETLRQYIFMALRIVAAKDLPKAIEEYRQSIGHHFKPEVGRAITERYALLHTLLGFATTERLLQLTKRNQRKQHA